MQLSTPRSLLHSPLGLSSRVRLRGARGHGRPSRSLLKGSDNYLSGLVGYRVFLYRVHHNLDVCLEAARSSWSIQRS
jgi:hypothetical protein